MKGPDGSALFRNIQVGLACAECIRLNKGDTCTHNEDEIPPWKSREKFDMVKSLYGDRKDLLLRESIGAITEDQSSLFPVHWINRVFDHRSEISPVDVRHLIVACDPNGGGDSHMALVTTVFCRGQLHVVGIDSHPVRGHDQIEMLLMAHMNELRKRWPGVWIIFVGESNLGQEADHMRHMLKDTGFVHCVCEDGLAGVRTTNKRKELYSMELSKFMSQDAFRLAQDPVIANPFTDARLSTVEALRKQLVGFRKIILTFGTGTNRDWST